MSSHIVSFPLKTETWQDHILERRFHMARQAYNRVLELYLKRRQKYFAHQEYQRAHTLEDDEERKKAFMAAKEATGFVKNLYSGGISAGFKNELFKGTDIAYHLNSEMLRKVAGRAVESVFRYHKMQNCGKPKFKSGHELKRDYNAITGNNSLQFNRKARMVKIGGVRGGAKKMKLRVDMSKMSPKVEQSLDHHKDTSQCELVRKKVSGEPRYFIHLTCGGHAPVAPTCTPRKGVVGVDVGVRYVAAYSDTEALFFPICDPDALAESWSRRITLDKGLDRKRRINNPDAFDEKGQYVRGSAITRSKRHRRDRDLRDEMERRGSEERKRQHYMRVNRLLEMGDTFIVEDNSYKGWQASLFGSQVRDFAPSTFVDRLEEKAIAVGGSLQRVSTWDTYLSSRCHCGQRTKKPLSQRTHLCSCGVEAQRDLYSAFLARFVDPKSGELDSSAAKKSWPKAKKVLDVAHRI